MGGSVRWFDPLRRWRGGRKDRRRRQALAAAGIAVEVALDVVEYGSRTGVWPLATAPLGTRPLIYSFGVGDNAAWEEQVIARHGAEVHAFDPTPVSVAWVRGRDWPAEFHFHPVGLGERDGEQAFAPPRRGANFTPVGSARTAGDLVVAPVRRLRTLLAEHGHGALDVLKLDIEGGEYRAFADMLPFPVPVGQVLVEFHHRLGWRHRGGPRLSATLDALRALRREGYRVFWVSPRGLEVGLIQVDLIRTDLIRADFTPGVV